jgi:hypothetical protein
MISGFITLNCRWINGLRGKQMGKERFEVLLDAHVKSRCPDRDPDFSPLAKTSGLPAHV